MNLFWDEFVFFRKSVLYSRSHLSFCKECVLFLSEFVTLLEVLERFDFVWGTLTSIRKPYISLGESLNSIRKMLNPFRRTGLIELNH